MSTNKNALLRYQILDRCFSNFHRRYEIDDLVDCVNESLYDLYGTKVSMRQIRDDIKHMRDRLTYDAPIKAYQYDGKRCYYRYEDRHFTIFNNELSVEDVAKLRTSIEMLSKYRGDSENAWLEEVITNLEYRFGIKSNKENIVSFEQNEQLKGLEYLSDLIDYAINHIPLCISYKTYTGKESTTTVHPYHLKQFNNRWFLFGLEENEKYGNHITNMALDRIVSFRRSNVSFVPNTDFDFNEYFKDVVGVTIPNNDSKIYHIILKFSQKQFPYIVSKPIHKSQMIISDENCIVSIDVRPNNELITQILSFGPDVTVLSPSGFKKQIINRIQDTIKNYFSCAE